MSRGNQMIFEQDSRSLSRTESQILRLVVTANPAIKVVSVAERVKAGTESPHRERVHLPAGKSEAWRGFCRQVASFLSFTSVCHDRACERHGVAVQV